jgi:hypothetical protein
MNDETCKLRKQRFMRAIRLLAPGDQLMYQAAQRIPEERLPALPGGATLEFVAAFQELRKSINLPIKSNARRSGRHKPGRHQPSPNKDRLPLSHALRIRSAEYWLRLGEADQALRELEALPKSALNHPSAVETRVAAVGVLQERTGAVARE